MYHIIRVLSSGHKKPRRQEPVSPAPGPGKWRGEGRKPRRADGESACCEEDSNVDGLSGRLWGTQSLDLPNKPSNAFVIQFYHGIPILSSKR